MNPPDPGVVAGGRGTGYSHPFAKFELLQHANFRWISCVLGEGASVTTKIIYIFLAKSAWNKILYLPPTDYILEAVGSISKNQRIAVFSQVFEHAPNAIDCVRGGWYRKNLVPPGFTLKYIYKKELHVPQTPVVP